jgi:hypothetical protein
VSLAQFDQGQGGQGISFEEVIMGIPLSMMIMLAL